MFQQIVVAEIEGYDPAIYGTRTLRFATQGFSTTGAPLGDPILDSRFTVTRSGEATRFNSLGLVETVGANRPRFDYDPATLALKGLLIEESRQNTVTHSADFTNASWAKQTITATASAGTAPNGANVATKLVPNAGLGGSAAYVYTTASLSGSRVVSVFAKSAGYNLLIGSGPYADNCYSVFNFTTKTFTNQANVVASGYQQLPDGWFRLWIRVANTISNFAVLLAPMPITGNTDGTSGVLVWGAQSEAGTFLTSHIATSGSAVTRNIDRIVMGGSSFTAGWYGNTQGTLYAEASSFAEVGNGRRFVEISDGTTNNRQLIDISPLGPNRVYAAAAGSAVLDAPDDTYVAGSVSRIAYAYASGSYAAVSNGRTPVTSTSAAVPSGQNMMALGSNHDGTTTQGNALNGHLRRVMYWSTRLTNTELQQLTLGQRVPTGMTMDLDLLGGAESYYEARIQVPPSVQRECFRGGRTFGQSQIGFGDMVLVNNDGGLDYMLGYSYSGRRIVIRLGTLQPNGLTYTWTTILVGSMEQVELSWQEVTVRVRDRQLDIAKPLQQVRYAGGNALPAGLEGNDDDLKGKPKPLVYGKVFNISPPMVNTSRLIYQLHTGGQVVSIDGVYDRGVVMTAGAAYSSQADMEANAPAAGQYRAWNDATLGCFIRLGSNPTGTLTADVTQGSPRTVGQLFQAILLKAGVAASDISLADITALDAAVSYEVGVYAGVDDDYSPLELLDELCASVGAWFGTDINGIFRIGLIALPTGTSLGTITALQIIKIERIASRDPGVGIPAWKVKLGWQRVYTVQTDLNTSVTAARKGLVAEEFRRQEVSDEAVKTANLLSPELEFDTLLVNKANASAEASRRLTIYKQRRDIYQVQVRVDAQLASILDLGNIITLQVNRFGMSAGKKFLIIGVKSNMRGYLFDLTLWG